MTDRALLINRIVAPVTVLGPGTRVGVWVQGCTIGCAGCSSRDTWSTDAGSPMPVDAVTREVLAAAAEFDASGLSITGGEPFQQPDAVADLLRAVRAQWPGTEPMDALVFTGYAAGAARRRSAALWEAADVVVAGPYRRDRPSDHPLLGSNNQEVVEITALGAHRLGQMSGLRRVQIAIQGRDLALLGLPRPGDLDRLRETLERRGVCFESVSWQGRP